MPITAFSSFTDGLDPNRRSREHFITNINLEDDRLWVPYANGVWFQPCSFNVTSGGFSVLLKGLPGSMVGTHYHVGTVHGYTMRGYWRYLEHDWIAKPGTYIYEPTSTKAFQGLFSGYLRSVLARVSTLSLMCFSKSSDGHHVHCFIAASRAIACFACGSGARQQTASRLGAENHCRAGFLPHVARLYMRALPFMACSHPATAAWRRADRPWEGACIGATQPRSRALQFRAR